MAQTINMLSPDQVEQLVAYVQRADRSQLMQRFRECPAPFPVDFTDAFLLGLPVERLRHLYLALCLQSRYIPPEARPTQQRVA